MLQPVRWYVIPLHPTTQGAQMGFQCVDPLHLKFTDTREFSNSTLPGISSTYCTCFHTEHSSKKNKGIKLFNIHYTASGRLLCLVFTVYSYPFNCGAQSQIRNVVLNWTELTHAPNRLTPQNIWRYQIHNDH